MSKYSKNLSGQNAFVFVSPQINYTDDTTFAAFLANSPEGEIGVFLDTGAVKTTLLAATEKFFVAQKRDGYVRRSNILLFGDVFRKVKTSYDAPVRKVLTIGYNGTSSDIGFNFSGASFTAPQTYGIVARETTPGNQPFPVQEGYATVTSSTADEYSVLATIVSQLNRDFDYERVAPDRFVKAEILTNGTKTNLTNNTTVTYLGIVVTSTAHSLTVGTIVELRDVAYKVASVIDANSFRLDRPYQGASETITAGANAASVTYTSGTTLLGVRLTSLADETHFVVSGIENLRNDLITTITAWKLGAGSAASIIELEKNEAVFFDGVGSPVNAAFKEDYGVPSKFASSSLTYDQIFVDLSPKIIPSAALPIYEQKQITRLHFALPSSGNTPSDELTTIFGV